METAQKDTVELIIDKVKNYSTKWGAILNHIQDVASKKLTIMEWATYMQKANEDKDKTKDQDGVLFNGEYFDFHEFTSKRLDIVRAYLRYFNERQLQQILGGLN